MTVTALERSLRNELDDTTSEKTLQYRKESTFSKLKQNLRAQSTGAYGDNSRPSVAIAGSSFNFDKSGLLVILSPMDGAVQNVVSHVMSPIILYLALHSTLTGHPRERRLYDTLRCEYVSPNMSRNEHHTVRHFQGCLRIRIKFKRQGQLQTFQLSSPLEYIAIDIFGSFPRTTPGSQFVIIITDRHSELTSAIPTPIISSTYVAHIFFNNRVISYGIPDIILLDNGQQFVKKFFIFHVSTLA